MPKHSSGKSRNSKDSRLVEQFIEMMVALTLLSIFGTSLFLVQTNIFSKLSKTHTTVVNMFALDEQLLKFNQDVQFALQQKKPLDNITLHQQHKNPDYTVDIKLKKFDQNSKLFKDFGTNIRLMQATISQDSPTSQNPDVWYSFIYEPVQDKESQQAATSNAKGNT